jgi:hypothetical protein
MTDGIIDDGHPGGKRRIALRFPPSLPRPLRERGGVRDELSTFNAQRSTFKNNSSDT